MKHIVYYKFLIICFLFPMCGKAVEGVKLVCDEPVFNFGYAEQSSVFTNVFTVRNEGDLTFGLKYVMGSCSCVKGTLWPRMIGPGESAKLKAVYIAKGRSNWQRKKLRVISAATGDVELTLYVEGFVEPPDESR